MKTLFRKRKKDPAKALRELVGNYDLPCFPSVVMQSLRVLRDPNSSLSEIADTVRVDPGMVIRILGTVNSAAYGLARPVETLSHGVSLMGRAQIESLILALAVKDALPSGEARGFEPTRFWRAAARRAALAGAISSKLHPATQAECFTAALLQDMSIPVLASQRTTEYGPLLERWHENKDSRITTLESELHSPRHEEVGAIMGEVWGLPDNLIHAVGSHHGGGGGEVSAAVRLVACLRETEDAPGIERLVEMARTEYALQPDTVITMVDEAFEKAADLLNCLK